MVRSNILPIFYRVRKILAEVGQEKNIEKIRMEARLNEDLGIDSFGAIEAIFKLEDEFEITISERNFSSIKTVKDVVDYIESVIERKALEKEKESKEFYDSLYIDKSEAEEVKFNPYYKLVQSGLGRKILIEGRELISLGSNDYLGLANSEKLKEKAKEAIDKYGISMCGTPIVIGQTDINRKLELKIAEFLKQEDAILFPSGFQANIEIFNVLATSQDLIIADKNIHSSLIQGIALSKAKPKFFPHNDVLTLEKILKSSQGYRIKFIVVEGVYSTEGNTSPLDVIVDLSRKYNAFVILDDAHGIGVLGKEGRGVMERFNIFDVDLVSGSLGKALGCFGGFLAGKKKIIDYFRYKLPSYIYSTALPPSIAAACLASLDIVKDLNEIRQIILRYKEKLYENLKKMGYNLTRSITPLFSIIFENSKKTLQITKALFERGIYVTPFLPPSVPQKSPRIRLIPTVNLQEEDIEQVIEVFREIKIKYL